MTTRAAPAREPFPPLLDFPIPMTMFRSALRPVCILLSTTAFVALAGCGEDAEATSARKEIGEAARAVGDWSEARWNEFVDDSDQQLDRLRDEMEELRRKAEEQGEQAQQRWEAMKDDLQRRIDAAEQQLEQAKDKSSDAWQAAKGDLEKALGNVRDAFSNAREEIGK